MTRQTLKKHTILSSALLFSAALTSISALGGEVNSDCTALWQSDLTISNAGPKPFNGDTNAAYAAIGYYVDKDLAFKIEGKFPKARFFSIESYKSKSNKDFDSVMDFRVIPNKGQVNPYTGSGNSSDDSSFVIDVGGSIKSIQRTQLALPYKSSTASIWMRIYAPDGVGSFPQEDLPKLTAYTKDFSRKRACPKTFKIPLYTKYPQVLTRILPVQSEFDFSVFDVGLAGNNAIPGYSFGASHVKQGDVMIAKVLAPKHKSSSSQERSTPGDPNQYDVRYWSMCSQDVAGNKGLGCVKDEDAHRDEMGYMTVVVSSNLEVLEYAKSLGYNTIFDARDRKQTLLMLAFRNILPEEQFRPNVYKGEYNPKGKICRPEDFLNNSCSL
jgi:hypothetical protein